MEMLECTNTHQRTHFEVMLPEKCTLHVRMHMHTHTNMIIFMAQQTLYVNEI